MNISFVDKMKKVRAISVRISAKSVVNGISASKISYYLH